MELIDFAIKVLVATLAVQYTLARLVEWVARELYVRDVRKSQREGSQR